MRPAVASPLLLVWFVACTHREEPCDVMYPRMPDVVCGDSYVTRRQTCDCDGVVAPAPRAATASSFDLGCRVVETVCRGRVRSTTRHPP